MGRFLPILLPKRFVTDTVHLLEACLVLGELFVATEKAELIGQPGNLQQPSLASAPEKQSSRRVPGTMTPRLEIRFGYKSYIHDSHCAFYGLKEHPVELLRGTLKGLFYIFYAQKANERGTGSNQRTDSIYIIVLSFSTMVTFLLAVSGF